MSTTITLGGTDYIINPLTIKQTKLILPIIKQLRSKEEDPNASIDAMTSALMVILSKSYPDLSRDNVEDSASFDELRTAINTAAEISGLGGKDKGTGTGEAAAEIQTS